MKIKMLTSIGGAEFSVRAGSIVDASEVGGDGVAWAWIANGDAIEAPDAEAAAQRLVQIQAKLEGVTRERDGYAKRVADAEADAAKATKSIKAAEAERDVYKSKLAAAMTEIDALKGAATAKAQAPAA